MRPFAFRILNRAGSLRGASTLAVLALVALLTLSGCHHAIPVAGAPEGEAEQADQTETWPAQVAVEIQNHRTSDVVISVVAASGQTQRLGTVTAATDRTLMLSSSWVRGSQRVRLRAHPIGNPVDHTSESFSVQIGQRVILALETSLARSMLEVQ